jgi:hypothetical protein
LVVRRLIEEVEMSLNSLTTEEVNRGVWLLVPHADGTAAYQRIDAQGDQSHPPGGPQPPRDPITNAISLLTKYIPTEIITLYVAAVSVAPAIRAATGFVDIVMVYWIYTALTPITFLIIYLGKLKVLNRPLPPPMHWPWWRMLAAMVAFMVWALAIPNNPYVQGEVGGVVAGFGALFISTFLTLLEPFFES